MARELVVGIDFGGPATAAAQRRKIVAVAAERTGARRYAVGPDGLNARLVARDPPGWTAAELAATLASLRPAPAVVGADFPFCVPAALLERPAFAAALGHAAPFRRWGPFNAAVSRNLPLACPVDYRPFRAWRRKDYWLRRATDVAAGAHPALKDRFQCLFNMTLLGNAFLAALVRSGRFDVVPFHARGRGQLVEVYPGHALRALGVRDYKRAPARAIEAILGHLARRGVAVALHPRVRARCEAWSSGARGTTDHDAADALVAACIAILKREGLAGEEAGGDAGARRREGVIWSVGEGAGGGTSGAGRTAAAGPRRGCRRADPLRRGASSTSPRGSRTPSPPSRSGG